MRSSCSGWVLSFCCQTIIGSNSPLEVSIIYPFRTVYGETPVDAAFESGENHVIVLLDKEHLLPRDGDPELKADIIDVRHLQ